MGRWAPVKPIKTIAYHDLFACWLRHPVDTTTIRWVRKQCGRGGLKIENRFARFSSDYRQRVELKQPNARALAWACEQGDAYVNRIEPALDFVFPNPVERDDALEWLDRYLCRRWHAGHEIRIVGRGVFTEFSRGQTRYDGAWNVPNMICVYADERSRITGDPHVVHLEWRARTGAACRSAGVRSPVDLVNFDHRKFWERRLLFLDIDFARLGRLLRNDREGTKSRSTEWIDRRTGHVIANGYGTVQEIIDAYRGSVRIERALIRLDNSAWLPPSSRSTAYQ